jgi:hypothetical protein
LPQSTSPQLPDQAEFTALLNRVLLDAIKAAKFIRRKDLWRAKQLCDGEMKQHLLTMLEWEAAAQQDRRDIWYDGRFLSEWADPQAVAELPAAFAAYDAADCAARCATLDLFRRGREVAQRSIVLSRSRRSLITASVGRSMVATSAADSVQMVHGSRFAGGRREMRPILRGKRCHRGAGCQLALTTASPDARKRS